MVRPLSKIPENETRRGPKPGAYDADGFLVDDDDEVLSATAFPKVTVPSHFTGLVFLGRSTAGSHVYH